MRRLLALSRSWWLSVVVEWFVARDSSTVDMSGGEVGRHLYARDSSTVNISGGQVRGCLYADDSSIATFYARDFRFGPDLSLDGDRVLGGGKLSGEWFDGTSWSVSVSRRHATATIRVSRSRRP